MAFRKPDAEMTLTIEDRHHSCSQRAAAGNGARIVIRTRRSEP